MEESWGKESDRKKTFKEIALLPRVASTQDSDRDLKMYYFSGAHLPTGLVLALSLAMAEAKVKEPDQCQGYKCW